MHGLFTIIPAKNEDISERKTKRRGKGICQKNSKGCIQRNYAFSNKEKELFVKSKIPEVTEEGIMLKIAGHNIRDTVVLNYSIVFHHF